MRRLFFAWCAELHVRYWLKCNNIVPFVQFQSCHVQ